MTLYNPPPDDTEAHPASIGFELGGRAVGGNAPPVLIAEVGNTHDGNLNIAHAYIDAVAKTGAHVMKFQTHLAEAEGTAREVWRKPFSKIDATRQDYWRRMEFTAEQWAGLKTHCEDVGLLFLSSPFSPQAVDLLMELDVAGFKVASGETSNLPMLEQMAATRRPVLISTGMSPWTEIDAAVAVCHNAGSPHMVFHCTSAYPCPPQAVGLNVLDRMARRYRVPVGLSDHTGEVFAGVAAVARGAAVVEVHVCLSKHDFGPDVGASLTIEQLTTLAKGMSDTYTMTTEHVDKDAVAQAMEPMRALFTKSLVFADALPPGTLIKREHVRGKKPGDGIPVARLDAYLGRRLAKAVAPDQLMSEDHFV